MISSDKISCNLQNCSECDSKFVEEIYISETFEYYIKCKDCGCEGPKSLIQMQSWKDWNDLSYNSSINKKIQELEEELEYQEEELKCMKETLEELEWEIDYKKDVIRKLKKEKFGKSLESLYVTCNKK